MGETRGCVRTAPNGAFTAPNSWRGFDWARALLVASACWCAWAAPLAAQTTPPTLLVLSPAEGETEQPRDLLIAISLLDPDHLIDLSSIRLLLDDRDVTGSATVASDVVTWVADPPLSPGSHRFELKLRDVNGTELPGVSRQVTAEGQVEAEPQWGLGGRFVLESLMDDVSGPGAGLRQQPDQTNTARIRLEGNRGGWNFDGNLFVSSDEDKDFQPRNRYQLHLDHGWLGADVGDLNYHFSPLVLSGKRARGVGGYFRAFGSEFTLMKGAINRAIEGVAQLDSTGTDTTGVTGATFQRDIVGARVQVGKGTTFQYGFDGVRVRDDVESIPLGLLPKDNLVVGSNLLWAPFSRRIIFDANAALSFITDDISGGAISKAEVQDFFEGADLPFDPKDLEDIFIINFSTRPVNPLELSNLAAEGGVRGNVLGHIFEARYRDIGSTFTSLAAPSIQSDKRGMRVTDSFRLLRNRLQLSGEFENFRDNLDGDKAFTTDTDIWGFTMSVVPRRVDIKHVTFGYRTYGRANNATAADTSGGVSSQVDDKTNTLRFGAGYHFYLIQDHDLALTYVRSETDALQAGGDATQTDWNVGWNTMFGAFPLVVDASYGQNDTDYQASGKVKYTTMQLGGTYPWMNGRLETFARLVQVSGESSLGTLGADKFSTEGGARYRLGEKTFLSGRLGVVDFSDPTGSDYNETFLNVRLSHDL